jgi:hypothetical protein
MRTNPLRTSRMTGSTRTGRAAARYATRRAYEPPLRPVARLMKEVQDLSDKLFGEMSVVLDRPLLVPDPQQHPELPQGSQGEGHWETQTASSGSAGSGGVAYELRLALNYCF